MFAFPFEIIPTVMCVVYQPLRYNDPLWYNNPLPWYNNPLTSFCR